MESFFYTAGYYMGLLAGDFHFWYGVFVGLVAYHFAKEDRKDGLQK